MKRAARIGLWIAATVVLVALVLGWVFVWPYLRMPPESKADLDAKLAEYEAEARAMEARPKDDRQALDALIKDLDPLLKEDKTALGKRGCPRYDPKRLAALEPRIRELQPYFDRFEALTKDAFVLQQDAAIDSEIPHFNAVGGLIDWILAAAVLDLDEGDGPNAMRRLETTIRFADGLSRTPGWVDVFIGLGVILKVEKTVAYALPRLAAHDAARLRAIFNGLPDPRALFIRAARVETASASAAMDRIREDPGFDVRSLLVINDRQNQWIAPLVRVARRCGYLTRERYMHLSVASREIAAMEAWYAAGAGEPYVSPLTEEDLTTSYFVRFGYPNVGEFMKKASNEVKRRDALVKALDLELARRGTPEGATWETPFDEKTKLVRKPEYGCLVEVEGK